MEIRQAMYKLRAYISIITNECMRRMAYKAEFYIAFLSQIINIFIYCFLWRAVYSNSEQDTLNGFADTEMILYVCMAFTVSTLISGDVAKTMGNNVRDGSIAMSLIKPISYRTNLIFKSFGDYIYKLLSFGLVALVCGQVYKIKVMGRYDIKILFWFILSTICSFLIYAFFDFIFGLIAIRTTYSFGMLMIKGAIVSFLTGQLIPFEFMPDRIEKILKVLPFSSIIYTPVMIYLGKITGDAVINAVLFQLMWVVVFCLIGSLFWRRSIRNINVLGG